MSEDRTGVDDAVTTSRAPEGRGAAGLAGATTAALPLAGSVPLDADSPTDRDAADRPPDHAAARGADEPAADHDRPSEHPLGGVRRPARRRRSERQEPATVPTGPGASTAAAPAGPAGRPGVRRARLALRRVDPVSVFVLSLLISLFLGIVLLVAVGLLYSLLQSAGVLSSLDTFARELSLIEQDATIISAGRVFAVAGIVAAVDVVVITVLATLSAVLYNVCASFTGGIEVTLSERE